MLQSSACRTQNNTQRLLTHSLSYIRELRVNPISLSYPFPFPYPFVLPLALVPRNRVVSARGENIPL